MTVAKVRNSEEVGGDGMSRCDGLTANRFCGQGPSERGEEPPSRGEVSPKAARAASALNQHKTPHGEPTSR